MTSEINKQDIYNIYDRFCHIKKLLTTSSCKCDILNLNKCDNCNKIICDECDLVKCKICFEKDKITKWMCFNCAIYNKKDNSIYWYSCDKCKDI